MFKLQDTPGVYAPKNVAPIVGTPNESLVVVTEVVKEVEVIAVAPVVETPKVVEDVKTEVKIDLKRVSKKKVPVVEQAAE